MVENLKKTIMIKANELRIGNLVLWENNTYDGDGLPVTIFQAEEVVEIRQTSLVLKNSHALLCFNNKITPIPLTEEWLVKMGVKIEKYYDECGLLMMNIKTDFFEVNCSYVELKYVHQLQNLYFALTNIELIWNGEK